MESELLSMQNEALREEGLSYAEYLHAEGKAEGEAKGEARGKAEGRLEQARSAVVKCAEARFGELPYSVHEYLADEASLDRLNQAIVVAARSESLDAILRTLGLAR